MAQFIAPLQTRTIMHRPKQKNGDRLSNRRFEYKTEYNY
jgi:hypothetical protein